MAARRPSRPSLTWCRLALLAFAASACRISSERVVPTPLSYNEQEQQILEIVPLGTPSDQVVERLGAAGIEGDFGVTRTIYYCDLWNRDDGQRWHMNVALLFDDDGRLYKTRMGQSLITAEPDKGTQEPPASSSP